MVGGSEEISSLPPTIFVTITNQKCQLYPACFEQPAGVFAGCGAKYNPRVIASGTAMSLMGESSKSHLKVFSGFVLLMSLSCQRQATAKADICRCRSFGGDNIRTLT